MGCCDVAVCVTVRSVATYPLREELPVRKRIGTAIGVAVVALAAAGGTPQASRAVQNLGRLSGLTQITYGCPGPQREGQPCEHWSSFAQARFRVAKLSSGGSPLTVTSDRQGRFTLVLAVGRYRVTPLHQPHPTGGPPVTVTIQAAATTWIRVRFQGFPRML